MITDKVTRCISFSAKDAHKYQYDAVAFEGKGHHLKPWMIGQIVHMLHEVANKQGHLVKNIEIRTWKPKKIHAAHNGAVGNIVFHAHAAGLDKIKF